MLVDVLYYQLERFKILFLKRAMPLYLLPFLNFYSFMLEAFIIKNSLFLSYLCSIFQSCPSLWDPRLLCPRDSLSKNIGYVGSHSLLQGIFLRDKPSSLTSSALAGGFFITSATWEATPIYTAAAAAAAKSLQSCLTLCDLIDGSPAGSPVPGILQARTLEWVAISFSNAWKWKVQVKSLSRVWL